LLSGGSPKPRTKPRLLNKGKKEAKEILDLKGIDVDPRAIVS